MDHSDAVQQMAVERYLLDELSPEVRDAFEEHMFDCSECALGIRAGAAFVTEAKLQLPELTSPLPARPRSALQQPAPKKPSWFFWLQPAFAAPVFAALLLVIGYQNVATIPGLRAAAGEPRILSGALLHVGTRGAAHTVVTADRKQGAAVLIDLSQNSAYTSYTFELYDPQNKLFWTRTITAPGSDAGTLSLTIPASGLQQGSYTLGIFGVTSEGSRAEIDRKFLDIHFDE